ncbi:hypothetical protein ACFLXL_00385 [Chloroflexota bacterium]
MKNLVLMFLSVLISLAMILPATTAVMADSEKEVTPTYPYEGSLND